MKYDTEKSSSHSLICEEDGSVSFISLVVVLGMAVLIGFVGNMAHETIERQKLQNATDATAYSAAVWMSRGMNTISTCNHIMGELTAMIVLLEALGGPEAEKDEKWKEKELASTNAGTPEYSFNETIKLFGKSAPDFFSWGSDFLRVDKFVQLLVRSHPCHSCGAAIYDAEVNLKMHGATCLIGKTIASIIQSLSWIPIVGVAFKITGKVLHVLLNFYMKWITVETRIIRTLEKAVAKIAPAKAMLRKIIWAMDMMTRAMRYGFHMIVPQNDRYYRNKYSLDVLVTSAYGLPVELEDWKEQKHNEELYYAHRYYRAGMGSFFDSINKAIEKAKKLIDKLSGRRKDDANARIKEGEDNLKKKVGSEHGDEQLERRFTETPGWGGNPSIITLQDKQSRDVGLNVEYEYNTQWVRATYPYVDQYRRSFRNVFSLLILSEMNTFLTAWTYRYTIKESYDLHKKGRRMWVMAGSLPHEKGNEPWTKNTEEARKLASEYFSVITVAQAKSNVPIFSPSLFKKANSKGGVAISQAMIYNANGRDSNVRATPTSLQDSDFPQRGGATYQPNTGWDTLQWDTNYGESEAKPIEDNGRVIAREWTSNDPDGGLGELGGILLDFIKNSNSNLDNVPDDPDEDTTIDNPNDPNEPSANPPKGNFLTQVFADTSERNSVRLNWQAKMRPVDIDLDFDAFLRLQTRILLEEGASWDNKVHVTKTILRLILVDKVGGEKFELLTH